MKFDYTENNGIQKFDYTRTNGTNKLHSQEPIVAHPDGKAWPKCCRNDVNCGGCDCAFAKSAGNGGRARLTVRSKAYNTSDGINGKKITEVPFFCVHRTDEGFYRVCAGWDATFGNKHHQAKQS